MVPEKGEKEKGRVGLLTSLLQLRVEKYLKAEDTSRGQTDRGYKKTEPDPDICNLLFVTFKRNRIF